jgi:hypothetical protein
MMKQEQSLSQQDHTDTGHEDGKSPTVSDSGGSLPSYHVVLRHERSPR